MTVDKKTNACATEPVCGEPTSSPLVDLLEALTDFVARFAPAYGERHDGLYRSEDETNDDVLRARDDAVVAAFLAIERIAKGSIN